MKKNQFICLLFLFTLFMINACGSDNKSVSTQSNATTVHLEFYWHFDLDSNTVDSTVSGQTPNLGMDFYFALVNHNGQYARLYQNYAYVALIQGRSYNSITTLDIPTTFSFSFLDSINDIERVLLIRTQTDDVYKIGNIQQVSKLSDGVTFDYELLQAAP